jgi:ABC-2 type transport system permease protein
MTTGRRYGLRDVVRSEWTKFLSLRSSRWTLVAFAVTGVALGAFVSAVAGAHYAQASAETKAHWDPTNNILAGLIPGYLVIPVLGVLMMTSEYTSGSIRSTFAAVPRRPLVLAAKALVFVGAVLIPVEVVTFGGFFAGSAVGDAAPRAALGDPGVLRAVAMSGVFLVLMGLFGLGIGAIVRRSGAAVAVYVGSVLVVPMILQAFPGNAWRFGPLLILGNSVGAVKILPGMLSPWTGFAMMVLYTAVALAAGGILFVKRDA